MNWLVIDIDSTLKEKRDKNLNTHSQHSSVFSIGVHLPKQFLQCVFLRKTDFYWSKVAGAGDFKFTERVKVHVDLPLRIRHWAWAKTFDSVQSKTQ